MYPSIRQLTNAQGQITLANAYEPYGVLAQTTGSAQTSYGFTGEQTDPSGMVYLRARYYSPNDGRFLTRDTWMGDYNHPLSLNRWMYVEGNPVNSTDPSGQCYEDTGNLPKWRPWEWKWRVWEYPIFGPCEDHSDDVISPNNHHYHDYSTENVVCPAYLSCSQTEIADAMIRFTYPGQNPSEPIHDREFYFVVPFKGTPYEALGAIQSFVSDDHLTTANIALPTHIFYAGRVDRNAKLSANGDWIVNTRGTGNNIYFEMDTMNQETGASIFNIVDLQMRIYITENHFKSWLQSLCSPVLIPIMP